MNHVLLRKKFYHIDDTPTKNAWDDEEEVDDVKDDWDAPDPEPVKPVQKPITKLTKVKLKVKKYISDMTEEEKVQALSVL